MAAGVRRRAFTSRIWCAYTTSSPAQAAMTSSNCRYTRPTLAGDAMAVDT
ncbi:Uncharacterised protein [Bordetella pertussis]|nr:Uncharacterised protein [Bordetella pertussis]